MSKKYDLLTFEDFFMNFLLELKFLILSHPVTSKQPHKIVQILLGHPVTMTHLLFCSCNFQLFAIDFDHET